MATVEERKLQFIGRQTDKVRGSVMDFYIEAPFTPGPRHTSPIRHLIARYESGGAKDLPMIDGKREFATGIPDGWSDDQVLQKLIGDIDPATPAPSGTKQ
jgi:hypothetical protein